MDMPIDVRSEISEEEAVILGPFEQKLSNFNTELSKDKNVSLKDYIKTVKENYHPKLDLSFMDYFIELQKNTYGHIVHHDKLVQYGAISELKDSSLIKRNLDNLKLVQDIDYRCIKTNVKRPNGSIVQSNQYYLTPHAFKLCLIRATKHKSRDIDPIIYAEYYLFLERIIYFYMDYQLKVKDKKIEKMKLKLQQERLEKEKLSQEKCSLQEKVDKLLERTEYIIHQNDELKTQNDYQTEKIEDLQSTLTSMSKKMDTMMNLYVREGNGFLIFQKIIDDHKDNFTAKSTQLEKKYYPGLTHLKVLILFAFYNMEKKEIRVYCLARNLTISLKKRIDELCEKHQFKDGWRKLFPNVITLLYTEVNIEYTYLEQHQIWDEGYFDKENKCFVIDFPEDTGREQVVSYIRDGFDRAAEQYHVNNYQKSIYEYDTENATDEIIIGELKTKDTEFQIESRKLLNNIIKGVVDTNHRTAPRNDIVENKIINLSNKNYYMVSNCYFFK